MDRPLAEPRRSDLARRHHIRYPHRRDPPARVRGVDRGGDGRDPVAHGGGEPPASGRSSSMCVPCRRPPCYNRWAFTKENGSTAVGWNTAGSRYERRASEGGAPSLFTTLGDVEEAMPDAQRPIGGASSGRTRGQARRGRAIGRRARLAASRQRAVAAGGRAAGGAAAGRAWAFAWLPADVRRAAGCVPVPEEELEHLRRPSRTGPPLGNETFLEKLPATVGRLLKPQTRGPKPKQPTIHVVCP